MNKNESRSICARAARLGMTGALAIGLTAGPAAAQLAADPEPALPDPLTVEWCLKRAEQANPTLAVDAAEATAAQQRVVPAGALDDPRLGLDALNLPLGAFGLDATAMSGVQLGLRQKLPFPGVLSNREAAARAGAAAAEENLEHRRRRIAAAVEGSWAELGFAQSALEITDANLDLLRQITEIAETKYRVGLGLQQDVLRAQVELTRLLNERLRRRAALRAAEAALAALLDLSPQTALPHIADLADDTPLPDLDALLSKLDQTSPLLAALAKRIDEAESLHRSSVREGYPDFDLGLGYRIRQHAPGDPVSGRDFLSAGVTLRLPVNRSKWRAHVAERAAHVRRAKAVYREARAQLRDAARAAHAALERADSEVSLLGSGLVPQTRQSLDSSRSGYRVDRVDFSSLIDSQVRLLDAQLSLTRATANRRVAFAALEVAAGEDLR